MELGPPFAWEFCGRIGSAVTSQRAGPAAAMVAKDYPFYLTVKRANCSLEVPPASSPAKDAEEPSNKRVKPLSRVTSLANLIPPVKATPLKRFSQTLQVRRPRWTHVCRKPCYVGGDIGALTNPPLAYFNRRESR